MTILAVAMASSIPMKSGAFTAPVATAQLPLDDLALAGEHNPDAEIWCGGEYSRSRRDGQ